MKRLNNVDYKLTYYFSRASEVPFNRVQNFRGILHFLLEKKTTIASIEPRRSLHFANTFFYSSIFFILYFFSTCLLRPIFLFNVLIDIYIHFYHLFYSFFVNFFIRLSVSLSFSFFLWFSCFCFLLPLFLHSSGTMLQIVTTYETLNENRRFRPRWPTSSFLISRPTHSTNSGSPMEKFFFTWRHS